LRKVITGSYVAFFCGVEMDIDFLGSRSALLFPVSDGVHSWRIWKPATCACHAAEST
jgi:hypothetical protein